VVDVKLDRFGALLCLFMKRSLLRWKSASGLWSNRQEKRRRKRRRIGAEASPIPSQYNGGGQQGTTFEALVCMPTAAVSSASAGIRGLLVETYTEDTAGMERGTSVGKLHCANR
jgi:hypothetical protein